MSASKHDPLDHDPVREALSRAGAPIFWSSRCAEAVHWLCVSPQGRHPRSHYEKPRVTSAQFPSRGAFFFTRSIDGARFRLRLRKSKWKAEKVV